MATPTSGGKLTTFEQGVIDRVSANTQQNRQAESYFGAGEPSQPQAPKGVRGRTFDYPYGYNINSTPRSEALSFNIDFDTLRRIADPAAGGLDIVRLCIESFKDSIVSQKFTIRDRTTQEENEKSIKIKNMLRKPDGFNSWRTWLRPLIEDHLVIDQPAIYIRKQGKETYLDVADGALFKILIDPYGRTPQAPFAAYQQNIKGIPSVDYTTDELIIPIYNKRSNRVYGYSRVEQIVNIINLALQRQLSQITYWSVGSVPDMLLSVPDTWNPEQLAQYQEYFNALLSGNIGERHKVQFIPSGTMPHEIKEVPLKNELDDWLARIVSYCFSQSPMWAISDMNRATASTALEVAKEQGIEPVKSWLCEVFDQILEKAYNAPELEFAWIEETSTDPKIQAEILSIYVQNNILTVNEAREKMGLDPIAEGSTAGTVGGPNRKADEIVATPMSNEKQPSEPSKKNKKKV